MDLTQQQHAAQTMRQEQTMTHQQIQALEMLAKPALELQGIVAAELEKNPVLEAENPEEENVELAKEEEWFEALLNLDEQPTYSRDRVYSVSPEDEERRRHYLDSVTAEETFHESLLRQLRLVDLDDKLRAACEVVLSGLDDDGYLSAHPADLAMVSGQTLKVVNAAVKVIQQLEPAGVAAHDLRERLMIQLERNGRKESLTYIAVRDHLDKIANNQLPAVARKLRIRVDQLRDVLEEIRSLSPHLERPDTRAVEFVQEEATVTEEKGELQVQIRNDYMPRLFISAHYRKLLTDPDTPRDTRDYIRSKIRAATFLMNSLDQRQSTLRRIVEAIVRVQADFFHHGTGAMRPLTMSEIAKQIGVHETTVSRAVCGKYVRCKFGLFALRSFFCAHCESEDGGTVSSVVVRNHIQRLIADEDPLNPLSDGEIAVCLKRVGFKVARRTVAKYREQLGILSSRLRQKYWVAAV